MKIHLISILTLILFFASCIPEGKLKTNVECEEGQVLKEDVCVDASSTLSPTYNCIGNAPANASLCNGDDQGLLNNINNYLVANCSSSYKCEYVCDSGYQYQGGICTSVTVGGVVLPPPTEIIPMTYFCTGNIPGNTSLCAGDDSNLNVDTERSAVSSCTNENKCEYRCNNGFEIQDGICVAAIIPMTYFCTGEAPSNASLCSGDDSNLNVDTDRSAVANCTTENKCEYTCNSGYELQGESCQAITCGNSVDFAWDPNSEEDLAGYRIHYGTSSGNYTSSVDVGLPTTISGAVSGTVNYAFQLNQTYYFAAVAYNSSGANSTYSQEISWTCSQ